MTPPRICSPPATARSAWSIPTARPCRPRCWSRPRGRLSVPGDRLVLGPAEDGGYYLIGLKQAHPPPVRGYRLEHAAGLRADRRAGPRDRARARSCCRPGTMSTTSPRCTGSIAIARESDTDDRTGSHRARHTAAFLQDLLPQPERSVRCWIAGIAAAARPVSRGRLVALIAERAGPARADRPRPRLSNRKTISTAFWPSPLLQGAVYLAAVWSVWRGGSSRA